MTTGLRNLGLALLFLFTLEAVARIEDYVRYRTPLLSRYREQGELIVRDRLGAHGRPNARYLKWSMNNIGTRGPDVEERKPAETVRIATVGASETFGLYETLNREFPRQLEDSLNSATRVRGFCRAQDRRPFEVLNAAMPGMSLPTSTQDIQLRLSAWDIDVIVVYPSPAQYLAIQPPLAALPDSAGMPRTPPWTRAAYPRILTRAREQLKLLLPEFAKTWLRKRETTARNRNYPKGWRFDDPPFDRLALFDRDMRRVVGVIRKAGSTPVLVTHGNAFAGSSRQDRDLLMSWERLVPRARGTTIVSFDSLARLATLRVARDSSVPAVDVGLKVAGARWFQDFAHFNDDGATRVAVLLTPRVLAAAREALCATGR